MSVDFLKTLAVVTVCRGAALSAIGADTLHRRAASLVKAQQTFSSALVSAVGSSTGEPSSLPVSPTLVITPRPRSRLSPRDPGLR
eukprot:2407157-Rhodomonas_salina.1